MKWLNKLKSKTVMALSLFSLVSLFGSQAYAALPTDVVDSLTNAKTDVIAAGALVLVALVAASTYRYIRRAL